MEQSKIQWTNATWNPWHGCTKVSEGCKYCYMFRDKERYGQDPNTVMKSKSGFYDPLRWKEPKLIFTCSWSDFFIQDADRWRKEAWQTIKNTPHHTYQILTKRPERIMNNLPKDWGDGYPNVWLGVSVENRKNLWRAGALSYIPAAVRFISFEPLIGPIEIFGDSLNQYIDWVIIGGESGNEHGKYKYRESNLVWINMIKEYFEESYVPVFIKQLGTHLAKEYKLKDRHGGDWDEWPHQLRIREFPRDYKY